MKQAGFRHDALIYAGSAEYLAGTVPFIQAGLASGQRILIAVGPEQAEWLRRELGADAAGVRFVDMREVGRNPASIIPLSREFVGGEGGGAARGIGHPGWAPGSEAGLEECGRQEALTNLPSSRGPAWDLLCPYDAATTGDGILEKVAHPHPNLQREGRREPSATYEA